MVFDVWVGRWLVGVGGLKVVKLVWGRLIWFIWLGLVC